MKADEMKKWIDKQDWTQSDLQISQKTGVPQSTVRYRRISRHLPKRKSKWASVNFRRPTVEIAEERGVTTACVDYYRKKFAPETNRKGGLR